MCWWSRCTRRVQFPNSDVISHQVYSFSSARQFQLPLYRGKPYPPVVFDAARVVTLGCNIHDNMLAYIVVTGAPFFGRTGRRRRSGPRRICPRAAIGCGSGIRCSTSRRSRARRRRRAPNDARRDPPRRAPCARAAHRTAALMGLLKRMRAAGCARWLLGAHGAGRRLGARARSARRELRRPRILPRQRPGQAALRRRPPGHPARPAARRVEPAARRSVLGARRSVDLGRRRQESHRPHRGLSRIPAVSARGLRVAVRLGAFYPPMSLESRARRLGNAVHASRRRRSAPGSARRSAPWASKARSTG